MYFNKETIAEIKNNVNIVDVIGEVVSLTRRGRSFIGLCPFHNEKTGSFNVNEEKQFYHCFGCGKSGDVFKFIEDYRDVSFQESVRIVADRVGITIDLPNDSIQPTKRVNPNQSLYDIHEDATRFYHAVLTTTKQGEVAKQYLYDRGLDDKIIEEFKIGLAPVEFDYLYRSVSKKYDEQTILDSGLFNLSDNNQLSDTFRNRIMFPLSNEHGQVIGFSGRIWKSIDIDSKQAKYKNSRATKIFNKSGELYHLDKAKSTISKQREVYLMEGFMDVIAAYRAGIVNAVASMGTALTPEHVNHLKRFTKKVIITYDGDDAGQNAIAKSLSLLSEFQIEIVRIPGKMDPDEYIKDNSTEALSRLLSESRISDVEFWMAYLKPENVDNLQSQIEYVEKMASIIAKAPSITAQNTYISKLADELPDFDYYQVENTVNSYRLQNRGQVQGQQDEYQYPTNQPQPTMERHVVELPISKQLSALIRTENHLLNRLMYHPYLLNEYRARDDFYFHTDSLQQLYVILKNKGEITPYDLAQLSEDVQQAYYLVLEENLPEEVASGEIEDIEATRHRLLGMQEVRRQSKVIRDLSNHGDMKQAVSALEELIAQKRRME